MSITPFGLAHQRSSMAARSGAYGSEFTHSARGLPCRLRTASSSRLIVNAISGLCSRIARITAASAKVFASVVTSSAPLFSTRATFVEDSPGRNIARARGEQVGGEE